MRAFEFIEFMLMCALDTWHADTLFGFRGAPGPVGRTGPPGRPGPRGREGSQGY